MIGLLITYYCVVVTVAVLVLCVRTAYIAVRTPILLPRSAEPIDAVDVLVPARNEVARGLERHIRLLLDQTCKTFRVIVTDDRSTDSSASVLARMRIEYPRRLLVVSGIEKLPDWMGKTFALEQAKSVSSAPWIALVDADVACEPYLLSSAVSYAEEFRIDALCVLPEFEYRTFWIGVTLPAMIWLSAMRVSPTQTNRHSSKYAFGFGNFILIRRHAHDEIGGFSSYKSSVLDDCEVIERLKSAGKNVLIVNGPALLRSPMYDSLGELWDGFSKNSFAALRYSWFRLFGLLVALVALALQPFVAPMSLVPAMGPLAVGLIFTTAAISGIRIRAPFRYYLLFPIGFAICAAIIVRSAFGTVILGGTHWKGRLVK